MTVRVAQSNDDNKDFPRVTPTAKPRYVGRGLGYQIRR